MVPEELNLQSVGYTKLYLRFLLCTGLVPDFLACSESTVVCSLDFFIFSL